MNVIQQSLALLMSQITASAKLAENVPSNVSWWVSRHALAHEGETKLPDRLT